jgi:RNA polymerase sigma-70 factor (ECF subfamily)
MPHPSSELAPADEGPSDESLLQRLKGGDEAALEVLVGRYRRPLFGYLHRMLGCAAEAEDVFQETFLRVVKHRTRFEDGKRVRPWIYAIASNLVKNVYRSRGYREKTSLDGDEATGESLSGRLAAISTAPLDEAANAERAGHVREAVARLAPVSRDALVLFYFQGLAYEEIAQALEVPLGTVKSRIHNALAKLAAILAELAGKPDREAEHAG